MDKGLNSISVINVPTDIGGGRTGASLGPYVLGLTGVCQKLAKLGFNVEETGNAGGPANLPGSETGLQKLDDAVIWYRSTRDKVRQSLQSHSFPLVIGGDHSISIGSIAAISQYCEEVTRPLSVLWFDAHADFNTFDTTPSGNLHGMPAAVIAGYGHPDLLSIGHKIPLVQPENIYQVGLRSVDKAERLIISESKVRVFDMPLICQRGVHRIMAEILNEVRKKSAYLHVSFDVDCLDPAIAPGTGTRVPGGLNYREAQYCMEMVRNSGLMRSLDIVELNPLLDIQNQTGVLTMELLENLFGKNSGARMA